MKSRYFSMVLFAAAMGLASCGKESDDVQIQLPESDNGRLENNSQAPEAKKVKMTFKAGCNNENATSKTAMMDGLNLGFSAGDRITVLGGMDRDYFSSDVDGDVSATCNFTGWCNPDATSFYALYGQCWQELDADYSYPLIPVFQNAVAGSFDPKAHVMVAKTDNSDLSFNFKTVNAFLRITAPKNLKRVVMAGAKGEAIAGFVTVNGYTDFTISGQSETAITLNGPIQKDKDYYISYVPCDFENGIILSLVDEEDNISIYKTKKFEAKSNQLNKISAERLATASPVASVTKTSSELYAYLDANVGSMVDVVLSEDEYDEVKVWKALSDHLSTNVRLTLPGNVTSIGYAAFYGCSNLLLTSLPSGVTSIGDYAFFGCSNLALTSLPSSLISIGDGAFTGCSNLALTSLPSSLTSIGDYAFDDCSNLALTSLPSSLTSIEPGAFSGCSNLALTSLPSGVTSIGYTAFFYCSNLESINIPESVASIGNDAFYNCENLAVITILGTPDIEDADKVENDDFNYCPYGTINISQALYNKYSDYWDYWKDYYGFTVNVDGTAL